MKMKSRVPQWVAKSMDLTKWGISKECIEILQAGPKHGSYWSTWDGVLRSARRVVGGRKYRLSPCKGERVLIIPENFDLDTRAF